MSASTAAALKFQILDIIARDEIIEHEDEETREVSYAADDDYNRGYQSNKQRALKITLFGKTAKGQAIKANVGGFQPFFYVRLPDRASRHSAISALKAYLEGQGLNADFFDVTYEEKRTFFGYNSRSSFPFARISVQSLDYFRKAKNCFLDYKTSKPDLKKTGTRLAAPFRSAPKVFEANLDPMLRFFHVRNIDPCGWVSIDGERESGATTAECEEIDCEWTAVNPVTGDVAPFTVASWDIETYSASGDFTLAKMDYNKVAKALYETAKSPDHGLQLLLEILTDSEEAVVRVQPKVRRKTATVIKGWLDRSSLAATIATHCAFALPAKVTQDAKKEHINKIATELNAVLLRSDRMPLEGDPIIQIGTILATVGQPEKTERHVFVWPSCAPIDGVVVHECVDEKALIQDWATWIQERNPDVLVGYNVFGFDEKYISDRAEELGIADCEELQGLNRLHQEGSKLDIKQEQPDFKIEEKFLSSSALGDNFMYIWTMWGRLQVDLYHHVKRNAVLPSYKLDEVAKTYMSGKFESIEYMPEEGSLVMKARGSTAADAKPGRFICLLDALGETITEKLPVIRNEGGFIHMKYAPAFGEEDDEQWKDAAKWVIVKDDMPYDELFACHRRGPEDRARVASYCVQDCELVLDLYNKLEVFNTSMAMANVCTVPISYIFTRGQGIKIESLMFKEALRQGQAVEVLEAPIQRGGRGLAAASQQQESYEGAIVLDPTIGLLESPVGVADFASLYPSTIVSENISHDTLVWVKDFDHDGYLIRTVWGSDEYDKPTQTPMTDIEFDLLVDDHEDTRKVKRKVSMGKRICRFAQDAEGTVPQIIKGLLAARKATRALIPKTQDPLKIALLDAQQNAYKITANSLYGQLGSGTFKLRLQHLAASVTGYGRKQILFAKEVIETFYGPAAANPSCKSSVVYGDTDSLFVQFNPQDPETGEAIKGRDARIAVIDLTAEAGHLVTQALKAPHDFEFDKVFDPLLMFSKKRYAGRMHENADKPDDFVYKYMGIALKRRDNAPLVKNIYGAAMKKVLDEKDVAGAVETVKQGVRELIEGRVPLSQLCITKSLRAEYANPQSIAHKVLADRIAARDPGNAPAAGDRMAFAYVMPADGQEQSKLQGDRIETPQYIREKSLVLDYRHYIQNQLKNPISQMFALLLEQMPTFRPNLLPAGYDALDEDHKMSMREHIAADLLFGEYLVYLDKTEAIKKKAAFVSLLGATYIPKAPVLPQFKVSTGAGAGAAAAPAAKRSPQQGRQPTMDEWFSQVALHKKIDSNKRKAATAKEKAAKENTATVDA